MSTQPRMTAMGKVLDGLNRARTLLIEHQDQPVPSIIVFPSGKVDFEVSAAHTYDEQARRAAVDTFAESAHLPKPAVTAGKYTVENGHWKFSTLVKSERCEHCGGVK